MSVSSLPSGVRPASERSGDDNGCSTHVITVLERRASLRETTARVCFSERSGNERRMDRLRICLTAIACSVGLTVTACGAPSQETAGSPQASVRAPGVTASGTRREPSRRAESRVGQAVRAVRTAERRIRRSKAYNVETHRHRGVRVWQVKVARGVTRPYELDVRANGRVVFRQRRSRIDDDVRKLAEARIPLVRALRTAARRAGGGRFDEAEIDRSGGRIVWEVTFKRSGDREIEVKVDARTGKVIRVDRDDCPDPGTHRRCREPSSSAVVP